MPEGARTLFCEVVLQKLAVIIERTPHVCEVQDDGLADPLRWRSDIRVHAAYLLYLPLRRAGMLHPLAALFSWSFRKNLVCHSASGRMLGS